MAGMTPLARKRRAGKPGGRARTLAATALAPVRRALRVRLAGGLGAFAAPGGGEVQLTSTTAALAELGVDARPWRPWEDGFQGLDVLHLVGTHREYRPVIAAAQAAGVRVVVSPVAWFDRQAVWREERPLARRVAGCAALGLRELGWAPNGWRGEIYRAADRLLPNSHAESAQLQRLFQIDRARIAVVPNGTDLRFATATPEAFYERFGLRDFVLCCGRIEPRKNQLALIRALAGRALPLVLLGDAVPGAERYLAACKAAAGEHVTFLPALAHDDPLLASAYAACRCLVLASWFETPGLAALEAALTGTPLVITERGCAREYFGTRAHYVQPDDPAAIRRAVECAVAAARCPELSEHVRQSYTWRAVAQATKAVYEAIL
ncbi:MAG: glycosyltransferase family 4 protein [Pirellulales bacterium]|nr:glycosyltransferase family 4 protein [Pirellulales bacterium]